MFYGFDLRSTAVSYQTLGISNSTTLLIRHTDIFCRMWLGPAFIGHIAVIDGGLGASELRVSLSLHRLFGSRIVCTAVSCNNHTIS